MSKAYEIAGQIVVSEETQSFNSGFTKRVFVVKDDDEKYPQEIKLEAVKDGCVKLDAFTVGDGVKVQFNLRGNEYNGKHYVNLQAWKIEAAPELGVGVRSKEYGKPETRSPNQNKAAPPQQVADEVDDDSDIPF